MAKIAFRAWEQPITEKTFTDRATGQKSVTLYQRMSLFDIERPYQGHCFDVVLPRREDAFDTNKTYAVQAGNFHMVTAGNSRLLTINWNASQFHAVTDDGKGAANVLIRPWDDPLQRLELTNRETGETYHRFVQKIAMFDENTPWQTHMQEVWHTSEADALPPVCYELVASSFANRRVMGKRLTNGREQDVARFIFTVNLNKDALRPRDEKLIKATVKAV